jgi:phenylpropionate dioxygenase-like ring-hydroxylating dioxygenase large terminal subunit
MKDIDELIAPDCSWQAKRIFWDEDLYELELERIFGRCWLFLTHESLIPKHGDFVTARMGEDKVIVCRQKDGSIRAFLNSCTHRGNQVCHADSGNARAFVCNYHGWAFGTDGALVDVPLEQRCHVGVDKSANGLPNVRVASYRGFVYGCMDPDAPSLEDYLGDYGWYLDTWMVGAGNGAELLGPPSKSILDCNWKVPAENFVGDAYHVGWTHAAALEVLGGELAGLAGNRAEMPYDDLGLQFTTRHGHGFGYIDNAGSSIHVKREAYDRFLAEQKPKVAANLGPERGRLFDGHWNCTVFPNNSFLYGTNTFKVWHPNGPHQIEVWTWTIVHKDMDADLRRQVQIDATLSFGTAGLLEADDGENMMTCTSSNRGRRTRQGVMRSSMGAENEGPHPQYPGIVGSSFIGETSYRGFYRFYREILKAGDWDAVRAGDARWDELWANRDYWSRRLSAA